MESACRDKSSAKEEVSKLGMPEDEGIMLLVLYLRMRQLVLAGLGECGITPSCFMSSKRVLPVSTPINNFSVKRHSL